MMVVCEGSEHATTEWFFSGCCAPFAVQDSAGAATTRAAGPGQTARPDARCADSCVDTLLVASAPEPTLSAPRDADGGSVRIAAPGAMAHLAEADRERISRALPDYLPEDSARSTVLLI